MDEPPPFYPSGSGLMALLTAMDERHAGGPSVVPLVEAAAQVPPVEAPPNDQVPPLQASPQDDARVQGAAHFDPDDGFRTPKKSPINSTSVSNVCP
jgi:hypothetical protein